MPIFGLEEYRPRPGAFHIFFFWMRRQELYGDHSFQCIMNFSCMRSICQADSDPGNKARTGGALLPELWMAGTVHEYPLIFETSSHLRSLESPRIGINPNTVANVHSRHKYRSSAFNAFSHYQSMRSTILIPSPPQIPLTQNPQPDFKTPAWMIPDVKWWF